MNDLSQYAQQVVCRNGKYAVVRSIRADDKNLLLEGFKRMSIGSAYNRFMGHKDELTENELKYLTEIDFINHVAIVLLIKESGGEVLIGVGRYFLSADPKIAECAFSVDDTHQNMGVGTILFEHIVGIAQKQGIETLHAELLVENGKMLEIFQHSGFKLKTDVKGGVATVEFSIQNDNLKRYYT